MLTSYYSKYCDSRGLFQMTNIAGFRNRRKFSMSKQFEKQFNKCSTILPCTQGTWME